MVTMMIENTGWPTIGRITTRSSTPPNIAVVTIAISAPTQKLNPHRAMKL